MPAGFVTTRPVSRFGDTYNGPYGSGYEFAFKFTCGGSGTFNATEIGIYVGQYDAYAPALQMAIFTHDAVNDCPDTIVANSQCSTIGGATPAWYYAALTGCQVTGGETYWICWLEGGGTDAEDLSCLNGSGAGLFKTGLTPYTFSTGDDWHTHTNQTAWTPDVYVLISPTSWSDDFNRTTENPLAAPWIKSYGGNCILSSNNVIGDTSGRSIYYYDSSPAADQYAQIVLKDITGGPGVRLATAALTGYVGQEGTTVYKVVRYNAGVDTTIIDELSMPSASTVVKITAEGSGATVTIKIYYNDSLQGSYNDTSADRITSGKIGFHNYGYAALDDWAGGEIIATAGDISLSIYDAMVLSESVTVEEDGFSFGHNTAFTGATDDLTQAFTCEANAKILILALVVAGTTNREYVAPTYNGVNMTQADIVRKYVTTPEQSCELWYMIDPPVSASYNIIIPNSGTRTLWCKATSFKVSGFGDAIIDTATGNTGVSANPSVSIVTTTNRALIYGVLGDGRNAAPTAQTGYNINMTLHSTYSDSNQYYIQTSAGSWACGWTCLSDDWCMCVAAFKLSLGISVFDCIDNKAVFGRN